jgi:hypothetical protein
MPIEFFGLWPANARLSPFIIIAGLCACISIDFLRSKKVIFLGIVPLIIISILNTAFQYQKSDKELHKFISCIYKIPENKKVLPIIVDYTGSADHTTPFLNAWAYYHIRKGGIGPYFFAHPYLRKDITPIRYKSEKRLPNPGLFEADKKESWNCDERVVFEYDYLIVYGSSNSLKDYMDLEIRDGKLRPIYQDGKTRILEVLTK